MMLHARTILSLLIGCQVAYGRRQDVFETAGDVNGEPAFPRHTLEEMHAVHPLITGLRSLPSLGDDKNCVATCNEDKLPTGGEPEFYECWGDFKWECDVDEPEVKMTTKFTCHGAFTVIPRDHDKKSLQLEHMPGLAGVVNDSDKNSTFLMTICEGSAMSITKVLVSTSDDADEDKDGMMSVQGGGCFGVSKMINSGSSESGELFFGCEDVFITGSATKPSKGSLHSATDELDLAADHFIKEFAQHGAYSAGMDDTPMPQSGRSEGEHKISTSDEWKTADATVQESAGLHAGSESLHTDGVDAWKLWDKGHPGCKATCNGGPLPLYGWWPCRGKTELKCKGEKSDTCFELHSECLGVAFPAFKTCKGVATQHITVSTADDSTEAISINTGKTRVKEGHAHGWKGQITFSFGHSSVHSRTSKE